MAHYPPAEATPIHAVLAAFVISGKTRSINSHSCTGCWCRSSFSLLSSSPQFFITEFDLLTLVPCSTQPHLLGRRAGRRPWTMATTSRVVKGCIAFAVWWMFAIFPAVPVVPIGRTAGSLVAATLMVVFQVISPDQAFAAINLPILALKFATMLIAVYLERADLFDWLGHILSWRTRGNMDLLCRLCLLAALTSTVFTNDTICIVLTGFVLELCRKKNLYPKPFLLALACSSNIGSAATSIGNPQNLVIAVYSGISFGGFLAGVVPAVAIGLVVNTLLLLLVYGRSLSLEPAPTSHDVEIPADSENIPRRQDLQTAPGVELEGFETGAHGQTELPEVVEERKSSSSGDLGTAEVFSENLATVRKRRGGSDYGKPVIRAFRRHQRRIWKTSVYLVTLAMLAALLAGRSLPWTAMTAAAVMMVIDFSDAGPSLDKVPYSLLLFFSGMFIATTGFDATGVPEKFWVAVERHSEIASVSGVTVLALVVTILSNVASNVPTVILLGPKVVASAVASGASAEKAWFILAWVSTVAGNLTLLGSAANIIVSEQARETKAEKMLRERRSDSRGPTPSRASYDLTFWGHFKFGFPSALIVIAVGLVPIVLRKF